MSYHSMPLKSTSIISSSAIAEAVQVIHHTAIALTEDAVIFQSMGYHQTRTAATEEFLRSLVYYQKVLIQESAQHRECPQSLRRTTRQD
ncbi:hypothetical protein HDV57DRAFT_480691 [Trichoderma longibrachiatum]